MISVSITAGGADVPNIPAIIQEQIPGFVLPPGAANFLKGIVIDKPGSIGFHKPLANGADKLTFTLTITE